MSDYKFNNTPGNQMAEQLKCDMVQKLCEDVINLRKENEQLKKLLADKDICKNNNLSVTLGNPKYVSNTDKEKLLKIILDDFKTENPKDGTMTFQQVKAVLESRYGVETRTIGDFFRRQLLSYKTIGGNKKKMITLKSYKV